MGQEPAIVTDKYGLGAVANSKPAEILMTALVSCGHYFISSEEIERVATARARKDIINAQAACDAAEITSRSALRIRESELRHQRNIEAITKQAFSALPDESFPVSDQPVSKDFIYRFYEECKGISNEQMQNFWGKLLAGEVMQPNSFHVKTLSIVKNMQPEDAILFSKFCRFAWLIDDSTTVKRKTPLIFNSEDLIYESNGITFDKLMHLQYLGLITFGDVGFEQNYTNDEFAAKYSYANKSLVLDTKYKKVIPNGFCMFTEAGEQLSKICDTPEIPEFFEYIRKHFQNNGHTFIDSPA